MTNVDADMSSGNLYQHWPTEYDTYASYTIEDPCKKGASSKIGVKPYTVNKTGASYRTVRYDKHYICLDEPKEITQLRSVIIGPADTPLHVYSFSPPKSISLQEFRTRYEQMPIAEYAFHPIHVSEWIEGTLIHLFYDHRISSWEIATKNAVGGHYRLFHTPCPNATIHHDGPTVLQMVLEALCVPRTTLLKDVLFLEKLDKRYSYSFVLQHPNNPIILSVCRPTLYLVAVYDIFTGSKPPLSVGRVIYIPPPIFQEWPCFANSPVLFPREYCHDQSSGSVRLDHIERDFGSIQNAHDNMGVMITNCFTGDRCSIQNPAYQELARIRKTNTELQYTWLCLRRIGRTRDYLTYFPSHAKIFAQFECQYREFVQNLHQSYLHRHVYHRTGDLSAKYDSYVDQIHREIRQPSYRCSKGACKITRQVVDQFMKERDPLELLYALNYEVRQYRDQADMESSCRQVGQADLER